MLNKKKNYFNTEKLSKYDLINKYLYKNIYYIPKINKIKLSLSLNSLNFVFNENNNMFDKKDTNLRIKYYIFLFFFYLSFPLIKNNVIKGSIKNKSLSENENLFFIILFKNKFLVQELLSSLFIENFNKLILQNNSCFNKLTYQKGTNTSILKLGVAAEKIYDLSYIFNSSFLYLNSKDLILYFSFYLKGKTSFKNTFKTLPPLWLIN